jgi:hypothetical protein
MRLLVAFLALLSTMLFSCTTMVMALAVGHHSMPTSFAVGVIPAIPIIWIVSREIARS